MAETSSSEPAQPQTLLGRFLDALTDFTVKVQSDRKTQVITVISVLLIILGYVVYTQFLSNPGRQGTWRYAVCRTFLELHHDFPRTIDLFAVGENQASATIFYNVRNAFGAVEANNIYCSYKTLEGGRVIFDQVQINGENMDQDKVQKMSFTILYILQSDLDLALPPPPKGALEDFKDRKPFHIKIEKAE